MEAQTMRRMTLVLASFLLVAGVGAAAARGEGPQRARDAPARTDLRGTVTVPIGQLGHLPTVRALVNGSGPYRLAIDTGSADVLRVSAGLARALALRRTGVVRTGDPSGRNAVDVPVVRVGSVRGRLEPDGIIGLGLFASVTAQLDYPKRRLRLSNLALPRHGAHIVELGRRQGVPQIAVDAARKRLWADVDSGGPALLTVPRRLQVPLLERPRVVGRESTATNEFEIRAARIAGDLGVAGWTWRRPTIHIVDRSRPRASARRSCVGLSSRSTCRTAGSSWCAAQAPPPADARSTRCSPMTLARVTRSTVGLRNRENWRNIVSETTAQGAQTPTPDPALKRLDRLVGTWTLNGRLVGSDEETITGEIRFKWLEGGFFLQQDAAIEFTGMFKVNARELIGYDPETEAFASYVYSNFSPTPLPYKWDLRDDTLTISVSYRALDATFTGEFSDDGESFSGGWRPNTGADETINISYDVTGTRVT